MLKSTRGPAAWLLAALVGAVAALQPARPIVAQAPKLPPGLQLVPADAALFAHLDFAKLWNSPVGDTFRKAQAKDLNNTLTFAREQLDLTPDMIETVTAAMPTLKQPGDFNSLVGTITFRKPYNRAKLRQMLEKLAKEQKAEFVDQDGVITWEIPAAKFKIAARDPSRISVILNLDGKYLLPREATATGPLLKAINQAPDRTMTVGVNFGNFPEELRKDDQLPPEFRPFAPLFQSESMVLNLDLQQPNLNLSLKVFSDNNAKVVEAEKSLAAGLTLLKTLLGIGLKELQNSKDEATQLYLPLLKVAAQMFDQAKVGLEDGYAQVTSRLPADVPYGALLESFFGGKLQAASARSQATNNFKQIALALHNYESAHGAFPPAALCDKKGKPLLSWRVLILPFIEQEALYKQFRLDEPWDSEHNKKLAETVVKVFQIPGHNDGKNKDCHIRVFVGNGAAFDAIQPTKITQFTDGTSNTGLLFMTKKGVPWTKPDEEEFDPKAADARELLLWQDDSTIVAFADGSVRVLKKTINPKVLNAIITKDGGEVVGDGE